VLPWRERFRGRELKPEPICDSTVKAAGGLSATSSRLGFWVASERGLHILHLHFIFLPYMADEITGNLLVAQSGGLTSASTEPCGRGHRGVNHGCVEEIYGGLRRSKGSCKRSFDFRRNRNKTFADCAIRGAALGTTRFKLTREQDLERLLAMCEAHNIRFFTLSAISRPCRWRHGCTIWRRRAVTLCGDRHSGR